MTKITITAMTLLLTVFAGCSGPVLPTTLTVLFDNQSDVPVDPHFYYSAQTLTAADLFADPANLYQNFNGKTTIPAKTPVTVTLPAADVATLGSNQAAFGSLATFTGGKASESPVLYKDTDFAPGRTVTFTFSKDSAGKYHTTAKVN